MSKDDFWSTGRVTAALIRRLMGAERGDAAMEETRLESGQLLNHHPRAACYGNCCLHGTSSRVACRQPRLWRSDRRILEHICPCGIGHPCRGAVTDDPGVHGCCAIAGHC